MLVTWELVCTFAEAGNEQFPEQNITGSAKLDPAWRDYLFSSRKGVEWMDEISITLFRSKRSSYLRERCVFLSPIFLIVNFNARSTDLLILFAYFGFRESESF